MTIFKQLSLLVEDFVNWANTLSNKIGEWETDYPRWGDVFIIFSELIKPQIIKVGMMRQ